MSLPSNTFDSLILANQIVEMCVNSGFDTTTKLSALEIASTLIKELDLREMMAQFKTESGMGSQED